MPFHINQHPDGFYWHDNDTLHRSGPFPTGDVARKHRMSTIQQQLDAYVDHGTPPTLSFFCVAEYEPPLPARQRKRA